MKNIAIILASGLGARSGLDIPKQFVKIAGKTVLEHTIDIFDKHPLIDEIVIVTNIDYFEKVKTLSKKYLKPLKIVEGGNTRQESSYNGLKSIEETNANVLIHDSVRPFLNNKIINECISALDKYCAVDVAINSADTIIKVNSSSIIENIPERKSLKRGQTPQAFKLSTILKAHELAQKDTDVNVTDDCGLILKYNLGEIYVVEGDDFNMKITYPIDVAIADKLFQLKTVIVDSADFKKLKNKVAVVFGGTRGIGRAICDIMEEYSAKVYSCSKSTNVDVADFNSVKNFLKNVYQKENTIDYVINTAGILNVGSINDKKIEEITNEINVNYIGCINVAKASFEYLKRSEGHLQFFTSSSYTRGRANYAIYSSSKAAVVNFSQAIAQEWSEYNIKVNAINPQRTATKMRFDNFGLEPENTLLSPKEVSNKAIEVLLADITGQVVNVSVKNM